MTSRRVFVEVLLFLLISTRAVSALEPFELFGEPLLVPGADRLVIDSLVDFDVEIRERGPGAISLEVVAARRRSQEIYYEERNGTLRIEQRRRRSLLRFLPRRLLLTVPPESSVEVRTVTGDIRLDGLVGSVVLDTSSGRVSVSGSRGSLNISTASGSVDLAGGSGRTIVTSSSGEVRISNRVGRFTVETAAGDIRLRDIFLQENNSFISSAGNVDLRLRNSRESLRGIFDSGTGDLQVDGMRLEGPVRDSQGGVLLLARTAAGNLRITTRR
ncbi:MAG: DUF4097 family beta strand repeat-containing protein [Spirochaetaceae bacterium]